MSLSPQSLLKAADEAARRAYAPYSRFPVGAALETEDGRLFTGCNVENSSFGLTVCAERVALFQAVQAGCRAFRRIAIVAGSGEAPATPCGACRQVLAEFAGPDLEVLIASAAQLPAFTRHTLGALLPHAFTWRAHSPD